MVFKAWIAFCCVLTLLILIGWATIGRCTWCPSTTCYGPGTCGECVCVIPPASTSGRCYSIEAPD